MVSKKKSGWPPPGWTVEIKSGSYGRNYKCYINSKTGQRFYSKLAVLRCIKDGRIRKQGSHRTKGHAKTSPRNKQMHLLEANDSLDLPPGWTIVCRTRNGGSKKGTKYKCFIDPSTGSTFYSKPEVYRYLKSIKGNAGSSGQKERGSASHSSENRSIDLLSSHKSNVEPNVSQISKPYMRNRLSSGKIKVVIERTSDEELPSGWIKEMRIKQRGNETIRRYPCFIDPSTGRKFYSKPEVYRYLKSIKGNAGSSEQKESRSTSRSSSNRSFDQLSQKANLEPNVSQRSKPYMRKRLSSGKTEVVVERTSDEELPSGWIKEIRIKQRGDETIRSDPFYIDPASALVFRSKLEVLRYLETGEVSRHAYRRKNGIINGKEFALAKTSPTSSSKKEKTRKSGTKKQLFTNEASPKKSILALPEGGSNKEIGSKQSKRSSSRVRSPSVCVANLNMAQEMVATEPLTEKVSAIEETKGVTKQGLPKAPDADENENENDATLKKMKSTSLSRDKSQHVELQGCSNGKAQTSKRKTKDTNVPSLPFRSSKRLAGIEAEEVVFHSIPIEHARLATNMKASKTKANHRLDLIPNELQEVTRPLNVDPQYVLASQEEKAQALDVDTQTVFPTEIEAMKKNESLTQENGKEVVLQKGQVPIGFSQDPIIEVAQIRVDQSLEDPADTLPGSKFEKSPGDCQNLEELPASVERDTEQPESELFFPSPFWSDPCLEFAFKTLTGAIPLDDNVAIQDYIQHQNRTSKESNPDITVPNFCQNDEMKLVSPDVSFTNSNGFGFGSHKSSR